MSESAVLVSIITASYNCVKLIETTYQSIYRQTHQHWEWIVTDDFSSDGTYEKLLQIAKLDPRVKLYRNSHNSGAALSRNNSIEKSKGHFLAFIDSDDLWYPNKLTEQLNFMRSDIDFSFTAYELIDDAGKELDKKVDSNQSGYFTYEDMLKKKATLGCSTVMLRKSAFVKIRMPLMRTGQDYATWLMLLKQGSKAYILNKVLTKYRILPDSISRNKVKKAIRQWDIYRNTESLSLLKTIVCFSFYAWRAIFRK